MHRKGIPLTFFNLYNSFSTLVAVSNLQAVALVKVSVEINVYAFMTLCVVVILIIRTMNNIVSKITN